MPLVLSVSTVTVMAVARVVLVCVPPPGEHLLRRGELEQVRRELSPLLVRVAPCVAARLDFQPQALPVVAGAAELFVGCARHSRNTRGQAARAEQTLHVLTVVILAILDERLIGGDRLFGFLACAHTIGACDRTKYAALRNAVLPRVVQALHDRDKPGFAVLPGRIPDDSLRNLTRVRAGQHAAQRVRGVAIIL